MCVHGYKKESHTKTSQWGSCSASLLPFSPPRVALLSRVKREMWWISCVCLKEQSTSKTTFLRKRVQTCSAYFSLILRTQNFTGKLGGAGGEPGILQVNPTTQYTMEVLLGDSYPSPAPLCSQEGQLNRETLWKQQFGEGSFNLKGMAFHVWSGIAISGRVGLRRRILSFESKILLHLSSVVFDRWPYWAIVHQWAA